MGSKNHDNAHCDMSMSAACQNAALMGPRTRAGQLKGRTKEREVVVPSFVHDEVSICTFRVVVNRPQTGRAGELHRQQRCGTCRTPRHGEQSSGRASAVNVQQTK